MARGSIGALLIQNPMSILVLTGLGIGAYWYLSRSSSSGSSLPTFEKLLPSGLQKPLPFIQPLNPFTGDALGAPVDSRGLPRPQTAAGSVFWAPTTLITAGFDALFSNTTTPNVNPSTGGLNPDTSGAQDLSSYDYGGDWLG